MKRWKGVSVLYRYKGNHKYENKCRYSLYAYRVAVSFLLAVIMFFVFRLGSTQAVLGPVHVELNITGERLGHARANTPTAFKIFMRISEGIHTHDWVKVWFPTQEASDDWEDVCGEEFVIKGHDESPRFVPNEKYFEKYDNPEEERVGKLYEVLDERDVDTKFYDCIDCDEVEEGYCRLVEDPSGLGCWIMGTVLPALPRDRSDRKVITMKYVHACSPGYNPCSECMAYPIMIQDEKRCLFQLRSPVHVESWRQGYNPIDLVVSQSVGFITPATPGRYKIRVATEPEPTPVESDAFVLPCSQISGFRVSCESNDSDDNISVTIDFYVGEGGSLDAGYSTINIKFPNKFELPKRYGPSDIHVNGKPLKVHAKYLKDTNTLSIVSPVNIDNMEHVNITIDSKAGIPKPEESKMITFSATTSSEPESVSCQSFIGTPGRYLWNRTPEHVREQILEHKELPSDDGAFDHENASDEETTKYNELIEDLEFVVWGRRPEVRYELMNLVLPIPIFYESEYLLTYYTTDEESPTAFLGPDCCHYEPGFSAFDPFNPQLTIPYPGFETIFPYCDVMIKSWRECSIHCATARSGINYMMGIVGGDQCASIKCKKIRHEHDVYFLFIPSVGFSSDYTKVFHRFGEIYPVEFTKMLPNEVVGYTNSPGSVFLFQHDYSNSEYNLSVGKTPGDFDSHHNLNYRYREWSDWITYVYHMKPNGR